MLKDIQKEVDDLKKTLLPLLGNERTNFLRDLKTYVYVYCEISEDNKRIPIYIGKGKSDRCFAHLNNLEEALLILERFDKSILIRNISALNS